MAPLRFTGSALAINSKQSTFRLKEKERRLALQKLLKELDWILRRAYSKHPSNLDWNIDAWKTRIFFSNFLSWQTRWGCKTPVVWGRLTLAHEYQQYHWSTPPPTHNRKRQQINTQKKGCTGEQRTSSASDSTKTWHMYSKLQSGVPLKLGAALPTRHCKNIGIGPWTWKSWDLNASLSDRSFQIWDVFMLQEARQSFGKQQLHVLKSGSAYTCTSLSCGNWRSISFTDRIEENGSPGVCFRVPKKMPGCGRPKGFAKRSVIFMKPAMTNG